MIDLKTKHSDLIAWFQISFPDLVQSMKDANHHFDDQHLNPYHLEGDVWTHTNMVFKNSDHFSQDNDYVKWSSILHDIGKPRSREVVEERKRVRFIGHEGVSAFMVPDVLNQTAMSVEEKLHIFKLVALHGSLFHFVKSDSTIKSDAVDHFVGMKTLLTDLTHQVRCDSLGRWYEDSNLSDKLFTANLPEEFKIVTDQLTDGVAVGDNTAPTLTVLVGPPCSRKSTWLKNNAGENTVVISRDALVETAGEKRGLDYGQAFRFLNENPDVAKSEVDEVLDTTYKTARKEKKNVVIDMTSMSKKSRRKWVNEFKGYNIKCKVFVTGFEALLECNAKRGAETGKNIPDFVVRDMCKRFTLPMYSEGFTEIEYIWND
jgi:putative nucleotidyltransferase with HDIG domain